MAEIPEDEEPEFDAALIGSVARRASLRNIELTGSILTVLDDEPLSETGKRDGIEEMPSIKARGRWDVDRERSLLGVTILFAITPLPDGEAFGAPYYIGAEFRATYVLSDHDDLTDEALGCFARWNGQFNAWPYMREYVQSTASRAQIGEIQVPLYRIPSPVPTSSVEPDT